MIHTKPSGSTEKYCYVSVFILLTGQQLPLHLTDKDPDAGVENMIFDNDRTKETK